MNHSSNGRQEGAVRWRYLWLAALIFVTAGALLAMLWHVPTLFPQLAGPLPPTDTPAVRPSAVPTEPPLPGPAITGMEARVDDQAGMVTFRLEAEVPEGRAIAEVLLWYDTEIGHHTQRTGGPLADRTAITYRLDAAREGLTRTVTTTQELDYWWLVRDTTGESVRAGGTAILGPRLQAAVTAPAPEPPPLDFTWTVSDSQHFQFHYVSGSAAERDRFQIGALAEASLGSISDVLDIELDGQMSIYLVPRIFWQGGAAYGDKVQLISYLDRNYTGIETWSYFTHEGTHALAQDLLQPKDNGGGPDGILVEGLAVWASGGHYRREPIDAWAAVVADSDQYLPLADLRAGPFYDFQHETSYLEAGSFVKFLVERYGLDRLKELYGQATGDADHDEALVQRLYGMGYSSLEAEWLKHLAGLTPSPEQATTWDLKARSFDVMRRYETDLDPDARLLPGTAPPDWEIDTLRVFLHRVDEPVNIVLETALITIQERLYGGDPDGAAALLNDVEAALNDGGALELPSLRERLRIVELVAMQDRAILRADADAYRATLAPASALAGDDAVEEVLQPPYIAYRQEVVRLDLAEDGLSASGVLLLHGRLVDGEPPEDGQIFAVTFVKTKDGWRMTSREPTQPVLSPPPGQKG